MRKSRFSDSQILAMIKQNADGPASTTFAESTALARRNFTSGVQSLILHGVHLYLVDTIFKSQIKSVQAVALGRLPYTWYPDILYRGTEPI